MSAEERLAALAGALYETDPPESWMRTGTDEYRKRAASMLDFLRDEGFVLVGVSVPTEPGAPDPDSPQWESCKVCGGDHWTSDHPAHREPLRPVPAPEPSARLREALLGEHRAAVYEYSGNITGHAAIRAAYLADGTITADQLDDLGPVEPCATCDLILAATPQDPEA